MDAPRRSRGNVGYWILVTIAGCYSVFKSNADAISVFLGVTLVILAFLSFYKAWRERKRSNTERKPSG